LHILLAEDNPLNQRVAVGFLENEGHTVVTAETGVAVLAALEKQRFDLILMDVQMPEMDGLQTTARIRADEAKSGGHIPIIALTARAMQSDRESFLAAGMDDFVPKPIHSGHLFEVIERLLPAVESDAPLPAAAPPADLSVINPDSLAALRDLEEGGFFSLEEYIKLYIETGREGIQKIKLYVETEDQGLLERTAHTLKGSSGDLGAHVVVTLCGTLEKWAAKGTDDFTQVATLARELEEAFSQVENALQRYLADA